MFMAIAHLRVERLRRIFFKIALLILTAGLFCGCQPKEVTSARLYFRNNDWNRAIEQLEQAVKLYPNNPEAHFLLGQAYGRKERFKEMVREFDLSLKLSNKFAVPIAAESERYWVEKYNAAIIALDKEQYTEAENYLLTAILIDTSKYEGYKKLAAIYLLTNRTEKSLALYERLLKDDPQNIDLLSSIANIYYSQQRYQEAVSVLNKILSVAPDHRDALANLALSYDALGQRESAARAFELALAANPLDVDLIFLFGEHHYRAENYPRAIQLFERVLELRANDFDAAANIGSAYLSIAENLRQKLQNATLGPDSLTPAEIRQLKHDAIDNYKKSIPYLEKALELQPNQPNLWRNLGVAYVNSGQKQRGEEAFLKVEDLKMNSAK